MLEEILGKENMTKAFKKVVANKGACGVDGMEVEELQVHLNKHWSIIKTRLLEGKYIPHAVREVEIPKPNGGKRKLGIPTVTDRLIQQAIAQKLSLIYEKEFSQYSYGFRPGRSAHQAVKQAESYINEGNKFVVELDLEKFFDKVNHDRLMQHLSRRIGDKRLLKLIRRYLTKGIMAEGVTSRRIEGTPQGSPLSPLLSNIVLDELDKELESRGHRFVRYADDCSIYLQSMKAANRVLESITEYIEGKLKLKVNKEKSKVSPATKSNLLGFTFYWMQDRYRVRLGEKAVKRIKEKVREITNRSKSISMEKRLQKLNQITVGWVNYFAIADCKTILQRLDNMIRIRLRMCIWKSWKKIANRVKQLMKLGMEEWKAHRNANTRKSYYRTAMSGILCHTLTNEYFRNLGYKELSAMYLIRQV